MEVDYPLISILVLCYNNQKYLYENLESVFAQTYPNIEVLINDDGSSDFDGNALDAWISENKTPNITKVIVNHNAVNIGTAASVHYLQTIAEGIWLFNLDADDVLYDENVIMNMYNTAAQCGAEAKVVMAQTLMYDRTLSHVIEPAMSQESIEFLKTSDMNQLMCRTMDSAWLPSSYLYSRDILCYIEDIYIDYKVIEDIPAHIRLIRNGIRPYFCEITSAIKHRDGGISHGAVDCSNITQLIYKRDLVSIYEIDIIPYIKEVEERERERERERESHSSVEKSMLRYLFVSGDSLYSHISYVITSRLSRHFVFSEYILIKFFRKKTIILLFLSALLFFLLSLLIVDFNVSVLLDSICYIPFLISNVLFLVCICVTIFKVYFKIYNRSRR